MKYVQMAGLFMASLTAACGAAEPSDLNASEAQYSKELTIADETGDNLVFIKLTSNDAAALAAYREDSFTLSPFVAEEPDLDSDANATPPPADTQAEDAAPAAIGDGPRVSVAILSDDLAKGVTGYRLIDNLEANYRDPFVVAYRYSFNDCAMVTRVSTFNKVYVSMESQLSSGGLWSTYSNRVEVRRNNPVEACDFGSYQVRARVERRNSNDYTFWSHN
jgi:hypothetical protein